MRTVLSLRPMTLTKSKTARIFALRPTTMVSWEIRGLGSMLRLSFDLKAAEIRNRFAQRRLDAEVQRHVGAGALRAHAGQFHDRGGAAHVDELDVAAVR